MGKHNNLSTGKKFCPRCKETLYFSSFYTALKRYGGLSSYCKSCSNIIRSEFAKGTYIRKGNKRRTISIKQYRFIQRLKKYGLTQEIYRKMLIAQNYNCAICACKKYLVIDHCHRTGKVRGLLCKKCNTALGGFNDDTKALEGAIAYLNKVEKVVAV